MLPPSACKLEHSLHPVSCERSLTIPSTYPTPQHFALVIEQYSSVVEPDDAAVWSSGGCLCADNDGASDVSSVDLGGGKGGVSRR